MNVVLVAMHFVSMSCESADVAAATAATTIQYGLATNDPFIDLVMRCNHVDGDEEDGDGDKLFH